MSQEKHAAHTDPDFFPENAEFIGYIGAWHCYTGQDKVHMLFYLIRTKDLDWLEAVVKESNRIMSIDYVMSLPRHGSKREAAARLLDAHVRSRVLSECPVPPYHSGMLLSDRELTSIVAAIPRS